MNATIYGLNCDYVKRTRHYLMISREPGLTEEDMIGIERKMIQLYTIPGLLPLEFEVKDCEIRLRYDITGKKMISHYMKSGATGLSEYCYFILNLITVIEESFHYMIHENRFCIHEDFIFIGQRLSDVYLVYLPLRQLDGAPDLQEQLKQFMFRLFSSVNQIPLHLVQRMVKYLNDPAYNLSGLKLLINSILAEQDAASTMGQNRDNYVSTDKPFGTQAASREPVKLLLNKLIYAISNTKRDGNQGRGRESRKSEDNRGKKRNLWLALLSVAPVGCSWIPFIALPSEARLYIALGCSLLIADGLYVISRMNGKSRTVLATPRQVAPFTTLLSRPDETVLLSPYQKSVIKPAWNRYCLEVHKNDGLERIPITKESFVIGRGPGGVDYVEHSQGVSRHHLELVRTDDGYAARDLASKNGSLLNQEPMTPYQLYPLQSGDEIRVVSTSITFKADEQS